MAGSVCTTLLSRVSKFAQSLRISSNVKLPRGGYRGITTSISKRSILTFHHTQPQTPRMTTPYRLNEAIAMLKPILRYPRVQCANTRVPRATFTASHAPRATHSTSTGPAASSGPARRAVTVANDTGSVKWGQLSVGEKMARTTQQSVNLVVVAVGVVLTVCHSSSSSPMRRTCAHEFGLINGTREQSPTSSSQTSSRPPQKPHTSTARPP